MTNAMTQNDKSLHASASRLCPCKEMTDAVAQELARCAAKLRALSCSHESSTGWDGAGGGIATLIGLCRNSAAAADAAWALCNLSALGENKITIRELGGIPLLVALLADGPESVVAERASAALCELSVDAEANRKAIREAGGIPLLVALLAGGPESVVAERAAGALDMLSFDEANRGAIREAGGIPLLVALLAGGPESEVVERAAGALNMLSLEDANCNAIREAGGIPLLVALLAGGPESDLADMALEALQGVADDPSCTGAVLDAVAHACAARATVEFPELHMQLQSEAASRLFAAEAGSDTAALERAIELATAMQVDGAVVSRAQAALDEMSGAAERRARRESLGIGSLPLPEEFICPITMDKMRGACAHMRKALPSAAMFHITHPCTIHALSPLMDESYYCLLCVAQTRWWRATATRTSAPPSWM